MGARSGGLSSEGGDRRETVLAALAVATIALHRGEDLGAMWMIVAAVCVYALAYRFYSKFVALRLLVLDRARATPADTITAIATRAPIRRSCFNIWHLRNSVSSCSRTM